MFKKSLNTFKFTCIYLEVTLNTLNFPMFKKSLTTLKFTCIYLESHFKYIKIYLFLERYITHNKITLCSEIKPLYILWFHLFSLMSDFVDKQILRHLLMFECMVLMLTDNLSCYVCLLWCSVFRCLTMPAKTTTNWF